LIWPVLIAAALWVFRSQLKTLLQNLRVQSVEAAGVKVGLREAAQEAAQVLKENADETEEEVAKAEDPVERERLAAKLRRETAALTRIEAAGFEQQQDERRRRGLEFLRIVDGLEPRLEGEGEGAYLAHVFRVAEDQVEAAALPQVARSQIVRAAAERLSRCYDEGKSFSEASHGDGRPEVFVANWIADWPASSI
jgi:hypothetical protein